MPRVSVVVPVYNVEPYIDRCIESILAQTYGDYELITVDDGDPSGSGEILDGYALRDSRIKVVHKPNGGVSSARNAGIDLVRAESISFIDSDDWVEDNYLEALLNCSSETGADIVIGGFSEIDENMNEVRYMKPCEKRLTEKDALYYYYYYFRNNVLFKGAHNKLIHADIVRKIKFPTDRAYTEDFAITYKWYYEANYVVGIPDRIYNYCLSDSGICRNFSVKWLSFFITLSELISFLDDKGFNDLSEFYREHRFHFLKWVYSELSKNPERNTYQYEMDLLRSYVEEIYRDKQSRVLLNATEAKKLLTSWQQINLVIARVNRLFSEYDLKTIAKKSIGRIKR